ncbi:MAG TPA: M15 family metallopeptidase [Candidatus Angelobacter sp.]|nr:M15 family metallopeptidase [Candidatus Angelobacter sp.]
MDSISETRLQTVFPLLADKIRQLADEMAGNSIDIRVVQALRTVAEQDALFAQGRTAPGSIVTKVRGGFSYHNFGLAVDCVPSQFGPDQPFNPDWNSSHPTWKTMEQCGQDLGLISGSAWRTFPDAPHFQLNGRFPQDEPDDEVRTLAQGPGGLQDVWDAVTESL